MSMLRAVPRASTWSNSEYVCLCCRRRLAQWQQKRGYSNAGALDEFDDDWASNLNNINEESQAKKPADVVRKCASTGTVVRVYGSGPKEDATPFVKSETRRERMARQPERTARQSRDFEDLKKSLGTNLKQAKASTHQNESAASNQLSASSVGNGARSAAISSHVPIRISTRTKRRTRTVQDGHRSASVAAPAPAGRVREPTYEAIIQELKADFLAQLPQLTRDIAKRNQLGKRLAEVDEAKAGQPIRILEESSSSDGVVQTCTANLRVKLHPSDSTMPNAYTANPAIDVERPEQTKFRKMYDDAMKSSYPSFEPPASPDVQNENIESTSNVFDGDDRHNATEASTDNSQTPMPSATHEPADMKTSTADAALEFLERPKPRFSMADLMADLQQKVGNQAEARNEQNEIAASTLKRANDALRADAQDISEKSGLSGIISFKPSTTGIQELEGSSTTDPRTVLSRLHGSESTPFHDNDNDNSVGSEGTHEDDPSTTENVESTKVAGPGMFTNTKRLMAGPTGTRSLRNIETEAKRLPLFPTSSKHVTVISKRRRAQVVYCANKRSMSTTAQSRAPAVGNVESKTVPESSTDAIPPWGMTGSENKSSTHGIQQSSSDADSGFVSLLPTSKQKKLTKGKKNASENSAETEQAPSDSVAELLQNLLSKDKETKTTRAFEKHMKKVKARSASEKEAQEKQARTTTKETRRRVEASKKQNKDKSCRVSRKEAKQLHDALKKRDREGKARAAAEEAKQKDVTPRKTFEDRTSSSDKLEQTANPSDAPKKSIRLRRIERSFRKAMGNSTLRKEAMGSPDVSREMVALRGPPSAFRKHSVSATMALRGPLSAPRKHPASALSQKQSVSPRRMRTLRQNIVRYSGPRGPVVTEEVSKSIRQASDVTKTEGPSMTSDADDARTLDSLQNEFSQALSAREPSTVSSIDAGSLTITPLNLSQPPVPKLQYGLDRTLFNPGVFQLQDPHSRVYNFDPYLQKIMPVMEFDYNALKQYKTSSQDTALSNLAKEHGKRYIGSTSSMTSTLGHFHYLISAFRPLNLKMLSRSFPDSLESFTQINRAPNAIFLRNKGDRIYAIDADKEYDGPNVLMMLGKSMEKLLTLPKADYERYRKENSHEVTEEERTAPEAYEYTTMGSFLMRSQLDAHDPRLPGTGMFDLKTRAVLSVRMNTSDYEPMTGYEIQTLQGRFQSYEREYYDMLRSTMLKYMLQVRMGRMDGIFLAYHNVERIFGFQYVPLHEMDRALHWQTDPSLGDQEFKLSLDLLNKALDKATAKFPNQSLRLHFETSEEQIGTGNPTIMMWIFAEPMAEAEIDRIQSSSYERTAEFERTMMGIERADPEIKDADPETKAVDAASDGEATTASPIDEYSTTMSDAAPTFPTEMEKPRELKPLFSASIVCKSRVNDSVVQRPQRLKRDDTWELEYLLQEWDTNEMMWARYEDVKSRRKSVLEQNLKKQNKDQEVSEEDGSEQKKGGGYVEFLKSMSQQGRAFRDRMDELDAGRVPVVVGQPLYTAEEAAESKIEGLDDYLECLYRGDAQGAQKS